MLNRLCDERGLPARPCGPKCASRKNSVAQHPLPPAQTLPSARQASGKCLWLRCARVGGDTLQLLQVLRCQDGAVHPAGPDRAGWGVESDGLCGGKSAEWRGPRWTADDGCTRLGVPSGRRGWCPRLYACARHIQTKPAFADMEFGWGDLAELDGNFRWQRCRHKDRARLQRIRLS